MHTDEDGIEAKGVSLNLKDDSICIKGIWDPSEEYRVNGDVITGSALADAISGEPLPLRLPDGSIGGEARLSLREDGRVDIECRFANVMDAAIYAKSLEQGGEKYGISAEGSGPGALDEGLGSERAGGGPEEGSISGQ